MARNSRTKNQRRQNRGRRQILCTKKSNDSRSQQPSRTGRHPSIHSVSTSSRSVSYLRSILRLSWKKPWCDVGCTTGEGYAGMVCPRRRRPNLCAEAVTAIFGSALGVGLCFLGDYMVYFVLRVRDLWAWHTSTSDCRNARQTLVVLTCALCFAGAAAAAGFSSLAAQAVGVPVVRSVWNTRASIPHALPSRLRFWSASQLLPLQTTFCDA